VAGLEVLMARIILVFSLAVTAGRMVVALVVVD
jgi:hypothetical protein